MIRDQPSDLILVLETIIQKKTILSYNESIQNLLILTSIKVKYIYNIKLC